MRPIGDEIPLSYNQLGSPMSRSENAAPGKPMCDRLHQKGPLSTIIRKIWDRHVGTERPDGMCLLYIDRHLVHEVTSPQAFEALRLAGRKVRRPLSLLAVPDHNVPTSADRLERIEDPDSRRQIEALRENAREAGIALFDIDDIRQGIVHVPGPGTGPLPRG